MAGTTRRSPLPLRRTRRSIAAIVLVAATAGVARAQAFTVGVIAGVNRANLGGSDAGHYDARTGLIIGGTISRTLTDVFAVELQGLYSQKGGEAPAVEGTGGVHLDYFEVPLLLKAMLPVSPSQAIRPYLIAGPAVAFRIKCDLGSDVSGSGGRIDCDDPLLGGEAKSKSVDYGLLFGGGTDIRFGGGALRLEVRYDLGLSTIDGTQSRADVKNRVWSFLAGLSYGIGK
ncbi:MAG: PorT family protein [Gemmatimonadota bacterium]|nr:PorT family protein [Gemmatimonadota bacterium]